MREAERNLKMQGRGLEPQNARNAALEAGNEGPEHPLELPEGTSSGNILILVL